jgi:signal transduction histidine kinase
VNPRRDTLDNFVSYTCTYAEDYLRLAQIQCRLDLPAAVPEVALRTDLRHGLFLVVKEALNNVVKHAAATEVKISMEVDAERLVVCLQDNGKGFRVDPEAENHLPGAGQKNGGGEGLLNMRQRVESMNGRLVVFSAPSQGTQVRVSVPITKLYL